MHHLCTLGDGGYYGGNIVIQNLRRIKNLVAVPIDGFHVGQVLDRFSGYVGMLILPGQAEIVATGGSTVG